MIEHAYRRPLQEVFLEFDERPLASASIAQVHTARLMDGTEVVVKVVRPGIQKTIRRDVSLLGDLARLAERYWREGRRLRPCEVVKEFEKTLHDELDLLREASNASQLRRNFSGDGASIAKRRNEMNSFNAPVFWFPMNSATARTTASEFRIDAQTVPEPAGKKPLTAVWFRLVAMS